MENLDDLLELLTCPNCNKENENSKVIGQTLTNYQDNITVLRENIESYKEIAEGYKKILNAHIEEVKHLNGVVAELKSQLAMKELESLNESIKRG